MRIIEIKERLLKYTHARKHTHTHTKVSWNVSGMDMNAAHYVGLHKDPDLFNQVYVRFLGGYVGF